ncbi:XAP5-domain-containing protein [Morchella conica CCBAS932]|uniref:XAP5-domain-containing protein n=1 Tax=Morchella conica CCBAS932 TaxID=1392247 RepID=A0A3N4KZE1_9PEZI|nr:XAP5-domain-containing protein [Morchella conica CCBAS932]
MSSTPPTTTTTANSRFTPNTETLEDALKTQTVGLVHLSDFKKRRVELAEQREREAAEKLQTYRGTSSREGSETPGAAPAARKKKRKTVVKGKLSFGGDEEGETPEPESGERKNKSGDEAGGEVAAAGEVKKRKVNPKLRAPPPKVLTKNTLLREAQERETLRREFLALQEKIKNEEISIPFVFYDGTNVAPPDGSGVQVKKGEMVWLFLERARRMSGRREWLRVSVDDLLLVRGEVIIPHHYEFYYFIVNRTQGPNGTLFDYPSPLDPPNPNGEPTTTTQGGKEDPTMTKVVDRRWYERNKHIFPASVWTEFDPNTDYRNMVRRDQGGNAFFFG